MKLLLLLCLLGTAMTDSFAPSPVRVYDFVGSPSLKDSFSGLTLNFIAFNQTFELVLEKNTELLSPESVAHLHNTKTGETQPKNFLVHPYRGYTKSEESKEVGWARIMFYEDPLDENNDLIFDGSFYMNGIHHISTISNYQISRRFNVDVEIASPLSRPLAHQTARMIVFKDGDEQASDLIAMAQNMFGGVDFYNAAPIHPHTISAGGCGYTPSSSDTEFIYDRYTQMNHRLEKRQNNGGCYLTTRKVLPMGVAADCSYVTAMGSAKAAFLKIISNWNQASQIYETTFNIALSIVQVKILEGCGDHASESLPWNQDCSLNYIINDRLSDFSNWRGTRKDNAGLWHLMTKCNTGPSVGLAWLDKLCVTTTSKDDASGQFVNGAAVSSITNTEWKVVAHEIGHNFGAVHDCISSNCANNPQCSSSSAKCVCCPCSTSCDCGGKFIMHPTDNSQTSSFSPCSINFMCAGITQRGTCLKDNSQVQALAANVCGNGVREDGEDCDCGAECANNSCCDGSTCRFKNGAQCDDAQDECCNRCQLLSKGTVCRQSTDVCSFTQVCDGINAKCPPVNRQPDGQSCKTANSNLTGTTCASGICTSRDLQCSAVISDVRTVKQCVGRESDCSLVCQTAQGTCLKYNAFFIDGTPCGDGGLCKNGQCTGLSILATIAGFFKSSPQIAIPVTIVIVILILLFLYSIIKCCCKRKKKEKKPEQPFKQTPKKLNSQDSINKEITANNSLSDLRMAAPVSNSQYELRHNPGNYPEGYPTYVYADGTPVVYEEQMQMYSQNQNFYAPTMQQGMVPNWSQSADYTHSNMVDPSSYPQEGRLGNNKELPPVRSDDKKFGKWKPPSY